LTFDLCPLDLITMITAAHKKDWRNFLILQIITFSRIPLAILFSIILIINRDAVLNGSVIYSVILLFILIVCELTDLIDGILARKLGLVSELGSMHDPYSDSISRMIVFWALGMVNLAFMTVVLVMAFRDVTVAYCRIVLTKNGKPVSAKWSGKVKAVIQGVAAMIILLGPLYWNWIGYWVRPTASWIVIVATLASIFEYAGSAIKSVKEKFED